MSDVQRVVVQVQAPSDNDMGRVTEGYYTLRSNVLTMTDGAGNPVQFGGEVCRRKLKDSDNPRAIAAMLTKQIRRERVGGNFNRRISYPRGDEVDALLYFSEECGRQARYLKRLPPHPGWECARVFDGETCRCGFRADCPYVCAKAA